MATTPMSEIYSPLTPGGLLKATCAHRLEFGSNVRFGQGKVYDVTGNKMYQPGGSYHGSLQLSPSSLPRYHTQRDSIMNPSKLSMTNMLLILSIFCFAITLKQANNLTPRYTVFAGRDASRALALTSTKAEDVRPDWSDLSDKEKGVLEDWNTFFSKRYNVVGWVEGATNKA